MKIPVPQSDPKLIELAQKIEELCQSYGVGGFVGLASSTHSEFRSWFPAWSLIQNVDEGVRVRLKSSEQERSEASVHLCFSLRDNAGLQYQQYEAVCKLISEHRNIEHHSFSGMWDLDGWKKPNLPDIDTYRKQKRKKPKGFRG
jgi:hypothetical protein